MTWFTRACPADAVSRARAEGKMPLVPKGTLMMDVENEKARSGLPPLVCAMLAAYD